MFVVRVNLPIAGLVYCLWGEIGNIMVEIIDQIGAKDISINHYNFHED